MTLCHWQLDSKSLSLTAWHSVTDSLTPRACPWQPDTLSLTAWHWRTDTLPLTARHCIQTAWLRHAATDILPLFTFDTDILLLTAWQWQSVILSLTFWHIQHVTHSVTDTPNSLPFTQSLTLTSCHRQTDSDSLTLTPTVADWWRTVYKTKTWKL